MNISELRAELGRQNVTMSRLAQEIGISKKAMYDRFKGGAQFKQSEISSIKSVLHLSDERVIAIFFSA